MDTNYFDLRKSVSVKALQSSVGNHLRQRPLIIPRVGQLYSNLAEGRLRRRDRCLTTTPRVCMRRKISMLLISKHLPAINATGVVVAKGSRRSWLYLRCGRWWGQRLLRLFPSPCCRHSESQQKSKNRRFYFIIAKSQSSLISQPWGPIPLRKPYLRQCGAQSRERCVYKILSSRYAFSALADPDEIKRGGAYLADEMKLRDESSNRTLLFFC